jgi:hypothetical protein
MMLLLLLLVWAVYSSMHVAFVVVGCRLCGANNGQGDVTAVDAAGCLRAAGCAGTLLLLLLLLLCPGLPW